MNAIGRIGIIMPEITDPLDYDVIRGVYSQAKELGYDVLIFTGIFVVAILCAACIPLADAVMTEDGRHAIIEKTENSGSIKYIIFYFLQIVQIVVVFIPGGPIPLIGSMLFGEWMTLILSAAGCLAGTAIVYFIVKSAGMRVVNIFVSEEKFRSYGFEIPS